MTDYIVVPPERAGLELDEFLCLLFPEWNKGFLRRRVRDGVVRLDGALVRPSKRLRPHQVISFDIDGSEAPRAPVAPREEVCVLFENDDVLVIDKPTDLATEPERWHRDAASLAGGLLELARARSGPGPAGGPGALGYRPRLVHRIDKGTSGAVVVAKHLDAERRLRKAFDQGRVKKEYLALVEGEHPLADGQEEVIDLPLGPDARKSGRQVVDRAGGKPSRTRIRVEERFRGFTALVCEPLTGRTHQIRVHLAHTGFPLIVDPVYGRRDALRLSEIKADYRPKRGRPERALIERLTLHSRAVAFPDVGSGEDRTIRVEAPEPKDLKRVRGQLAKVRRWTR